MLLDPKEVEEVAKTLYIRSVKLLPPDIANETLKYFDDFYRVINNPRSLKGEVIETCLGKKK